MGILCFGWVLHRGCFLCTLCSLCPKCAYLDDQNLLEYFLTNLALYFMQLVFNFPEGINDKKKNWSKSIKSCVHAVVYNNQGVSKTQFHKILINGGLLQQTSAFWIKRLLIVSRKACQMTQIRLCRSRTLSSSLYYIMERRELSRG